MSQNCLSSRLSHRELRSALRESHSFLSLTAHTTMEPSQGTQPSKIHSAVGDPMIYCLIKYHFLFHFYAFFSSVRITLWPMWLANSKQQPCFYPTQSHAQEDTELTNCAVPQNIQFWDFVQFFYTFNLHSLTESMLGLWTDIEAFTCIWTAQTVNRPVCQPVDLQSCHSPLAVIAIQFAILSQPTHSNCNTNPVRSQ
jgi:hypothetical protein